MITIKLNGENKEIQKNLTIQKFLQKNNINFDEVVIEHNLNIVKSAKFNDIILNEGDSIEILKFIGGG
ncbi:MAG: sulfur carrier protein ThiS [Bacteroidales bacterium OttesenSCG-928-I14]|jgi:thiamine biosynthesis protein ThiS|nr:sulfur carrier protein ThiS [Bacteroidales bacterium OttesenSCG-928-I14]